MFALAFLYQVFIFNIFMARLAVEPGPAIIEHEVFGERERERDLLASSADWVMKKPTEFAGILDMWGLMQIFWSPPASSDLTSMARRRSLSLMKHSLEMRQ